MKPRFQTFQIDVGYERYSVLCRVVPAKQAPHVGADSPRYLEPGSRGSVFVFQALRGSEDVTKRLDLDLMLEIEREVARQAGIPARIVTTPEAQLALPLGGAS